MNKKTVTRRLPEAITKQKQTHTTKRVLKAVNGSFYSCIAGPMYLFFCLCTHVLVGDLIFAFLCCEVAVWSLFSLVYRSFGQGDLFFPFVYWILFWRFRIIAPKSSKNSALEMATDPGRVVHLLYLVTPFYNMFSLTRNEKPFFSSCFLLISSS